MPFRIRPIVLIVEDEAFVARSYADTVIKTRRLGRGSLPLLRSCRGLAEHPQSGRSDP